MGGVWGEIEGKTKLEVWLGFKRLLREESLDTLEGHEAVGLYVRSPLNKREAFKQMCRNEDDSGWVLVYHFHT